MSSGKRLHASRLVLNEIIYTKRLQRSAVFFKLSGAVAIHIHHQLSIMGNIRDREIACSASDLQGLNFESCVISLISPPSGGSPGPIWPVCAQKWPNARFISFIYTINNAQKKQEQCKSQAVLVKWPILIA